MSSASNNVSGALTGVTLALSQAAVGTTQTVTLSQDTAAATTAINNFATAYTNFVNTANR